MHLFIIVIKVQILSIIPGHSLLFNGNCSDCIIFAHLTQVLQTLLLQVYFEQEAC